jgi:hypothetical protein
MKTDQSKLKSTLANENAFSAGLKSNVSHLTGLVLGLSKDLISLKEVSLNNQSSKMDYFANQVSMSKPFFFIENDLAE